MKQTLWEFSRKINKLLTYPDDLKEKPISFAVVMPDEPKKLIVFELEYTVVDESGIVLMLKIVKE